MAHILLKPVFKEAWSKVAGTKQTFFLTFVALGLIQLILLGARTYLLTPFPQAHWITLLSALLFAICCIPIITGLSMMGLSRAYGQEIHFKQGFIYFKKLGPLFLTSLMILLTLWVSAFIISFIIIALSGHSLTKTIIVLVFVVNVLWTFILGSLFSFALMNVADQNQTPWQAYKNSFKMVLTHFKPCMLAIISCLLINIAAAIPFGIGFIWSLPFMHIVMGILYRQILQTDKIN